jgi:hypothetical protein
MLTGDSGPAMNPKVPGAEEKHGAPSAARAAGRQSVPELVRSLERASMQVQSVLEEVRRRSPLPPAPTKKPSRPPLHRHEDRPVRALVLSEDARTRRLRVTELLAAGVEVDWSRDIEEALFRASCAAPDVIVLDGPRDPRLVRQILDHLASFAPTRAVPVILRSDFALSPEVRDRCAAVVRGPGVGDQIVGAVRTFTALEPARRGHDR